VTDAVRLYCWIPIADFTPALAKLLVRYIRQLICYMRWRTPRQTQQGRRASLPSVPAGAVTPELLPVRNDCNSVLG
jgi:hypothetical protein